MSRWLDHFRPFASGRLRWVPLALLGALIAIGATALLFSTFMVYDDEGYVLFSLKAFVQGGGLYERVYSQYGPFFFVFNQGLHALGFEFTNTGGRLLTLVCWLGATGLCGAIVWRLTRSLPATIFTLGGMFLHLWVMINEPSHPGGFISLVVAFVAWLGGRTPVQPRRLALGVGLAGAALVLTKINVGIFLCAGAGAWWALHLDSARPGLRLRAAIVGLAMTLMPMALMRPHFDESWVVAFAVIAAASGLAAVLAAARGAEPVMRWRDFGLALVAGLLTAAFTFAVVLARGTSPVGLLEGVLLGPLRHPQAYMFHVLWRPGAVPLALGSLVLATWAVARPSPFVRNIVAVARLLAVAGFFSAWLFTWSLNPQAFALSYGLAAVWLFVYPIGDDVATQPARAWLGLLLVPQALHAYPVAGSQIAWGTFLWIPLAAVGLAEALRLLVPAGAPRASRVALALGGAMLVGGTFVRCTNFAWIGVTRLRLSASPQLPGAEALRLPENIVTTLHVLTRNTSAHADMLFSLPGMLSFHLWTDVPPPTPTNTTHWFTLLSPAQQEAIRARLAATPRSCVIVQRHIYQFLVDAGIATESPLTVWLKANYEPAFKLDSYEFWVPRGRHIAALGTATAREGAPGITPRYQISVILAEPALSDVTSIELGRFYGDISTPLATWTAADAQLNITPINSTGATVGPTRAATFPFAASRLVRLDIRTDRMPPGFLVGSSVLYFRDSTGRRVAEARFVE